MNKFFSLLLIGALSVLVGCGTCCKKTTCSSTSCPQEEVVTVDKVSSKNERVSGSHPQEVRWDKEDLK